MYEECDSHELNLFIQDKLISMVPKQLRKLQQQQGFTPEDKSEAVMKLGESVMSNCDDEVSKDAYENSSNPLVAMH